MASPDPADVVLHWLGDESVFVSGIPNRDITEADALSDEDLKRAVKHGTHEKPGRAPHEEKVS